VKNEDISSKHKNRLPTAPREYYLQTEFQITRHQFHSNSTSAKQTL